MISIGNDIIALQLTNSERTPLKRFYSKILIAEEVELYKHQISTAITFEHFVWLAWSVKESVYKFYKRYNQQTLFSPIKIAIRVIQKPAEQNVFNFYKQVEKISLKKEDCYCCEINFNSINFYTRSFINNDLIFTVANNSNCFENIHWGIKYIDDDNYLDQSKQVRAFTLKKLNKVFSTADLNIEKAAAGYPIITQQKSIPLSFSHHGNFVSYAFITDNSFIAHNKH